jgi:hypothetical protein
MALSYGIEIKGGPYWAAFFVIDYDHYVAQAIKCLY